MCIRDSVEGDVEPLAQAVHLVHDVEHLVEAVGVRLTLEARHAVEVRHVAEALMPGRIVEAHVELLAARLGIAPEVRPVVHRHERVHRALPAAARGMQAAAPP